MHHNLKDQKYIIILASVKMEINIAKLRINSHELHCEIKLSLIPKSKVYYSCGKCKDENKYC